MDIHENDLFQSDEIPDPPDDPIPTPMLNVVTGAARLKRYSTHIDTKVWSGQHRHLINALADIAEAGEICRRMYNDLCKVINSKSK
jgi:hypothetical protein